MIIVFSRDCRYFSSFVRHFMKNISGGSRIYWGWGLGRLPFLCMFKNALISQLQCHNFDRYASTRSTMDGRNLVAVLLPSASGLTITLIVKRDCGLYVLVVASCWVYKSGRSFMYIKNNNGPRILLCGIPLSTSDQVEHTLLTHTLCFLSQWKLRIQANSLSFRL